MEITLLRIGLLIVGYLLGSIPSGLLVGKVFLKIDIREHGSKNIGASNAIRVMGLKLGALTLFLDAFKSAIIVIFVKYLIPLWIPEFNLLNINNYILDISIFYGVAAIMGHTFPIFIKFKGGKAVASSLGVTFALTPIPAFLCLLTYILVVIITKYASLGSTIAALVVGTAATLQLIITKTLTENLVMIILYWILIGFIFIRHIPNYKRLIKGTENKMYFIKKKEKDNSWSYPFIFVAP